mmetsp:Transcript_89698/g.231532  ORF Transcript_89698/g.231532 Transcript_89698/m.231532 type:complete len:241 (+) Transcript_89698:263-985(+)
MSRMASRPMTLYNSSEVPRTPLTSTMKSPSFTCLRLCSEFHAATSPSGFTICTLRAPFSRRRTPSVAESRATVSRPSFFPSLFSTCMRNLTGLRGAWLSAASVPAVEVRLPQVSPSSVWPSPSPFSTCRAVISSGISASRSTASMASTAAMAVTAFTAATDMEGRCALSPSRSLFIFGGIDSSSAESSLSMLSSVGMPTGSYWPASGGTMTSTAFEWVSQQIVVQPLGPRTSAAMMEAMA